MEEIGFLWEPIAAFILTVAAFVKLQTQFSVLQKEVEQNKEELQKKEDMVHSNYTALVRQEASVKLNGQAIKECEKKIEALFEMINAQNKETRDRFDLYQRKGE